MLLHPPEASSSATGARPDAAAPAGAASEHAGTVEDRRGDEASGHGPGAAPKGVGLETEKMRGAIAERLFDVPATPQKIGRFTVIDTIGRGAMGTVLSTWDPQLDRRVAVKVLHGQPALSDRERLLEEARALARLNHPNVVTVYEAGLSEGHVYMAMELVEGGTLRDACEAIPLRDRGRDRRVHAMFADAARGLAAAHRAGIVHRDVKPTNMLIDHDGRVRLADFGLARAEAPITREGDEMPASTSPLGEDTSPGPARDRTGWVGTPAYMAPEQFDGHADELSDQFNLCASFWEIVFGRPPYAGTTISETCGNVIEGRLQQPSAQALVPKWLRRILLRGIAIAPHDRFASVGALLREVDRRRAASRKRWLVGSLFAGAGLAAIVLGRGPTAEDVTARCIAEADANAPSFTADDRARLGDAFAATGLPFAESAWTQVELVLAEFGAHWREAEVEACRAEADPDTTTARDGARRRACLQRARVAFDALTEALGQADRKAVQRASVAAHALPSPKRCIEEGVERVLDDGSQRLGAAAEEIALAGTERALRRVDAARDRLERLASTLGDGDESVRTYVHQELATLAHTRADYDAVLGHVRAALADAELAADTEAQVHAWRVMSMAHARKGEAMAAEFAIERMDSLARRPDVSLRTRARAEWGAASTLVALKRYDAALPRFERALPIYVEEIRSPLQLASLRCDYAESLFVQEHIDSAIENVLACREAQIEGLGASHPYVAAASAQLAQYRQWAGDYEGAIEACDAAREVLDANPWFSQGHHVFTYKVRGNALHFLGRHEDALADLRTGLRLAIEGEGPDSVNATLIRSDMSLALRVLGRDGEAREVLKAAVESAGRNPQISGSAAATPRLNLALLLAEHGEPGPALEHLARAREILDESRPTESSLAPSYWMTVARVYRVCGRLDEARDALDRALASIEVARVDVSRRGAVVAEDAQLLDAAGERDRADARVEQARALLREGGKSGEDALEELEAWVRAREASPDRADGGSLPRQRGATSR